MKRKRKQELEAYTKRKLAKTARLEAAKRETAISSLQLSNVTVDVHEPDRNKGTQTEQWCIDASTQTEVSIELRSDSRRLKVENLAMAKKIQGYECTEDSLKEDDVRVKFYTGLSYTVLMTIFNFVASSINTINQQFPNFSSFLNSIQEF